LPDFAIRLARPEESAAIVALIHAAFAEYRGRLRPESGALSETSETIAAAFGDHWIAVAERNGALVGAVLYTRRGDDLYLGRLSTLPEHRGQGIAASLIAYAERHARDLGAAAVTLGVRIALPGNLNFFQALGYREIGRDTHAGFDRPTSIRLAKRLDPR
jgi:GNAT superfamily N-acetyltransferase